MLIQAWTDVVAASLENVWARFAWFIPGFFGAVMIVIIGLIVASGLGALVEKVFEGLKLDRFLEKFGLKPYFERAGIKLRSSYFLGRFTYWFIVTAFILAASYVLRIYALSEFLISLLGYLPSVIAAVLIMVIAVIIANFMRRVTVALVAGSKLYAADFLGALAWWAIVIFGFLEALSRLQIAGEFMHTIVEGFIVMLVIAGGLAFGLGGRDYAEHLLERMRKRTEEK